jgi:hypothetical protein
MLSESPAFEAKTLFEVLVGTRSDICQGFYRLTP